MSKTSPINRPGAPTNPPQHLFAAPVRQPLPRTRAEGTALPTGENTSPDPAHEVADPHPSNEGHPYRVRHPGGTTTPSDVPVGNDDIRPNPAIHSGNPEPRPDNAAHGPKSRPG